MSIDLNKNDMVMIREAAQGLSGPEVKQFIANVRDELDAMNVTPTKNHVRAACTKVLARGK